MMSPQAQAEFDKILADCDSAHRTLDAQRAEMETKIQALEVPTPLRPLTAAEISQLEKLNAAIDALSDIDNGISVTAIQAIEDSQAAQSLADTITAANKNLKTTLNKVNKTAAQVKKAAEFIQKLDGIAKSLIKLAGLLV